MQLTYRRSLAGTLVAVLAGLLALVLAVPANADAMDPFWSQQQFKASSGTDWKYGMDYYKSVTGGTPAGPSSPWPQVTGTTKQPVGSVINPFQPGGTTGSGTPRVIAPSNPVLTGKIIEPGKTIVRAPSTYATPPGVPTFLTGKIGLPGILAMSGVGMGGVSQPPANADQIALSQGVPQGCIDDYKTCTDADNKKLFSINNCQATNTCASIGALDGNGQPAGADWFKDEALPFLADLWATITGQKSDKDTAKAGPDSHQEIDPKGCKIEVGFEYRGNNNGTVHFRKIVDKGRPSSQTQQIYYDSRCAEPVASQPSSSKGRYTTQCINRNNGEISSDVGTYNASSVTTNDWNLDGTNKIGLCGARSPSQLTLYKIRFWNNETQAQHNSAPASYDTFTYSEWVNPDPMLNGQESTTAVTTWDCTQPDGVKTTYTRTVSKTGVFVSPTCPYGSVLSAHKTTATVGGSGLTTLDQGATAPGAVEAYPDCMKVRGCSMQVLLDGQPCTTAKAECANWPATAAASPSRVICQWGTYTVPMSDCSALANGYKSETGVVLDPISGGWIAIDTNGNPLPSNTIPGNTYNPTPTPGQAPGASPNPGTGTGTGGLPGPVNIPGSEGSNCWPSGVAAFNPLEWVLQPVKCALQWAFVPRQDVAQQEMTKVQNAFSKVPVVASIGTVTTAMGTIGGAADGGTGCMGPAFNFDFQSVHEVAYPFNACEEPVATMARITNAFTTVVVIVLGVLGVVRAFGASVGFNFTMGRGGES